MKRKSRKWIVCLLTMVMVLTMMPSTAFAAEEDGTITVDGLRYRVTGEDTVSLISNRDDAPYLPFEGVGLGQSTYSGDITVPATITDEGKVYNVTEIETFAFNATGITSITIPASVTKINSQSFYNCRQLTTVNLPEGITEIGGNAFENCIALSQCTIPSTVTSLGSAAFGGCSSLTSLHIPAGVTDGLVKALVGNVPYPHLENVTIAEGSPYEIEGGVLYRGSEAHLYVGPDEDVVLREGTTKIADDQYNSYSGIMGAFAQTYDLKSITIPEGITSIPANAFNSAVNMESVTLPDGLQEIGNRAFYNTGLLSIELPDSVETIGSSAFQGTIHMTSAKLPSNLKSMGEGAFCDAYVLESIVIPEGITEIPARAFSGCIALKSITLPNGLTSIGDRAFYLTTRIGGDYINPSPQLEYINIPSTVTTLGTNFLGGLQENGQSIMVVNGNNPSIFTEDSIAGFSDGKNQPTIYYPAEARDEFIGENSLLSSMIIDAEQEQGAQSYSIELPETAAVCPDDTVRLQFSANIPEGAVLSLSSDDTDIVTVDNDGMITGVAEGTTTIKATVIFNDIELMSDVCKVSVMHNASDSWEKDNDYHWHVCADCNVKIDEASHTFIWIIDKNATATEAGSKHQECNVCGYEKEAVIIPATGTTEDPGTVTDDDQGTATDDRQPQTGDETSLMIWIAALVISASAMAGITVNRKRANK